MLIVTSTVNDNENRSLFVLYQFLYKSVITLPQLISKASNGTGTLLLKSQVTDIL